METSQAPAVGSAESRTPELARIVSTPGTCGGKPRIDGHRIKVEHIAVMYERMGKTPDEIVTELPTISLAQVHAALSYYYDHKPEIDADIEEGIRFIEEMKDQSPPSKLRKILEASGQVESAQSRMATRSRSSGTGPR